MTSSSISCKAVGRVFGRSTALQGIDLTFVPGVTALLGPNGAGKSTLLRLMAHVDQPTTGTVEVDGEILSDSKRVRLFKRRLGWLPQSFGFPARMTVLDFLLYTGWLKEMSTHAAHARALDLIQILDLEDSAHKNLAALSGGTLRRAGLATALMNSPSVLLLDEPTVGLDPVQRDKFYSILKRLAPEVVVILSTHLLEDVSVAAEHIAVMRLGKMIWNGNLDAFTRFAHESAEGDRSVTIRDSYKKIIEEQEA